jgi:hypothetical protein
MPAIAIIIFRKVTDIADISTTALMTMISVKYKNVFETRKTHSVLKKDP